LRATHDLRFSGRSPYCCLSVIIGAVWDGGAALWVFARRGIPSEFADLQLFGVQQPSLLFRRASPPRASAGKLAVPELAVAGLVAFGAALLYGTFGLRFNPLEHPSIGKRNRRRSHHGARAGLGLLRSRLWWRDVGAVTFFGWLQGITASSLAYMFRQARGSGLGKYIPSAGLEFFISQRYLTAKRRDARVSVTAAIAAFGVCVGVAALIAVILAP